MRAGMRRFTCLKNGLGYKLENHLQMRNLHFVHYNFVRTYKSLKVNPAMAVGAANTLHDMEWIVGMMDERAPNPGPRGPYKNKFKPRQFLEFDARDA